MAGDKSISWYPCIFDFILVGQRLEQLSFTYFKGFVTIIDPVEV